MSLAIWKKCLTHLQKKLLPTEFSMWIRPLRVKSKKILYIYLHQIILSWIGLKTSIYTILKIYYINLVKKKNIPLTLQIENISTDHLITTHTYYSKYNIINQQKIHKKHFNYNIHYIKSYYHTEINKKYCFNNFIEGESNRLARYSSYQLAKLKNSYNPLFLYGNTGLGKTHLLHAIGNFILENNNTAKVIYIHSERFCANMVKSIKNNSIEEFKKYYRSVDALMIDDIQFFSNKERSQEELFHTFNTLFDHDQKIILTSDRYPKDINGMADRLKSRFSWGLTISINPPDLNTRIAILLYKAAERKIKLSYTIAQFIATKLCSNVRELEGILNKLQNHSIFNQKNINIELVQSTLQDLLICQKEKITIKNIQKSVSKYFSIKMSDMLSKKRTRSIAQPRQIAMALVKKLTNHSLSEIGIAFGGKDHTTVLHACRKIKELSKKIKKFIMIF
ncbi:chromosomal replication initiator protein [Buchnera aphidicola (Cinara tujafilina)]|uniref:Chromosomal replication initiator protein DnaA n=1 Tax=Buchnera aphidicola (Cinara tujafilina) TaxID=261317 RepID=F7WYV4_9GAMM|nr:chromosomal replication initiator protein [Buchnera aphidicola (Cinara tujafilina)]